MQMTLVLVAAAAASTRMEVDFSSANRLASSACMAANLQDSGLVKKKTVSLFTYYYSGVLFPPLGEEGRRHQFLPKDHITQ